MPNPNWLQILTEAVLDCLPAPDRTKVLARARGGAFCPALEPLEDRLAPTASLLKDINLTANTGSSNPASLTDVNGIVFFTASDLVHGAALWKSDGTTTGTVFVKGIGISFPTKLTNVNGTLFFTANDGTNGYELWKSDGTTAGTVLVKDILSGFNGSSPANLTNVNGTLF